MFFFGGGGGFGESSHSIGTVNVGEGKQVDFFVK